MSIFGNPTIDGLNARLDAEPTNNALRGILADAVEDTGDTALADGYRALFRFGRIPRNNVVYQSATSLPQWYYSSPGFNYPPRVFDLPGTWGRVPRLSADHVYMTRAGVELAAAQTWALLGDDDRADVEKYFRRKIT